MTTLAVKNRIENFFESFIKFKDDFSTPNIDRVNSPLMSEQVHKFTLYDNNYYMSFAQLCKIMQVPVFGMEQEKLRSRFGRDSILQSLCNRFEDQDSSRIKAANALGLHHYVNLTKSIRLYTPEAVEYILFSKHGETCPNKVGVEYQNYILKILVQTIKEKPEVLELLAK